MRILLLEDDYTLAKLIQRYLSARNYFVDVYDNGKDVLKNVQERFYDLYILDLNTPEVSGLACLEKINELYPKAPKIMISGNHDINHIVLAYDKGCSDYVKKPFNLKELELKINKLLETSNVAVQGIINIIDLGEGYVLNKEIFSLSYRGNDLNLSKREYELFYFFYQNSNMLLDEKAITDFIYKGENINDSTIRSLIYRLRSKLPTPIIENRKGFGYLLNIKFDKK
jgi:DNA-binding response OmpR family regulator